MRSVYKLDDKKLKENWNIFQYFPTRWSNEIVEGKIDNCWRIQQIENTNKNGCDAKIPGQTQGRSGKWKLESYQRGGAQ